MSRTEYNRAWAAKNVERRREYGRSYYQRNREKMLAQRASERGRNKERIEAAGREYRATNRVALRAKQRCRTYEIAVGDFEAMVAAQGGKCAACHDALPTDTRHQHIDHCHVTGKIRGVLCRDCNLALGNARDSVARLAALIDYLKRAG